MLLACVFLLHFSDRPASASQLYKDYTTELVDALQRVLALGGGSGVAESLPPMPDDADKMCRWHEEVMRVEHQSITDALSGKRLETTEGCVQIAIQGSDASGKPVRFGDAGALCAWLCGLRDLPESEGRCVLLTSEPAAGKTWLMSQVIMHALGGELVPILVKVERLQTRLLEIEAAENWVEAFLQSTCDATH